MDYKNSFAKIIKSEFHEGSDALISQTEAHYNKISPDIAFCFTSQNPVDRRLDFAAYFLAFILSAKDKLDFNDLKRISLLIAHEYVKPKNKMQSFLKKIPPKLIDTFIGKAFIKQFAKKVGTRGNADGFLVEIITDPSETYGFGYGIDIVECGICKLFRKYDAEIYVPILCEVDMLTSSLAGLKLIRKSTIAYGASVCDMRFIPLQKQDKAAE